MQDVQHSKLCKNFLFRNTAKIYYILILFLFLSTCAKNPEFSPIPAISFQSIAFRPTVRGSGESEQIVLWLNFQDGDGDLGLLSSDTLPPFQPYICNIPTARCDTFITFLRRRGIPNNPNFYNFFVEFLFKDAEGRYRPCEEIPDCDINQRFSNMLQSYNGRFRDLHDRNNPRPISGQLNYNLSSTQFSNAFRGRTLKLKVYIQDRKLNKSNSILTDSLTF